MKRRSPGSCPEGFSLVELLVAVAISMIMLVALALLASQSLQISRRTNNGMVAVNTASEALTLVATDLESLAANNLSTGEYLVLDTNTTLAGPGGVNLTPNPVRLMLNTISPNDQISSTDNGLTRAVCYYMDYTDPVKPTGTNKVLGLYRIVQSANKTFANFLGANLTLSTNWSSSLPPSVASISDNFIAGNVVDFQVVFFPSNTTKSINYTNSNNTYSGYSISGNGTGSKQTMGGNTQTIHGTVAEIRMTVINEAGAKILSSGSVPLDTIKRQYGHVLTRRVNLPGQ